MPHRLPQINNLIQREVNALLLREINLPQNCLATIIKVETTKDLRQTKIWVSVLPFGDTRKVIDKLNKASGHLQYLLNKRLILRPLPKIQFAADTTEFSVSKIERLLDEIKEKE